MEHTWKIIDMKRDPSSGLVTQITCNTETRFHSPTIPSSNEHETGSNFFHRSTAEVEITGSPSNPSFISFGDLTEEIVIEWVKGRLDSNAIETSNSSSIAEHVIIATSQLPISGTPWDN